jgi:hypothetical protein
MQEHIDLYHANPQLNMCISCYRGFVRKEDLQQHVLTKHKIKAEIYHEFGSSEASSSPSGPTTEQTSPNQSGSSGREPNNQTVRPRTLHNSTSQGPQNANGIEEFDEYYKTQKLLRRTKRSPSDYLSSAELRVVKSLRDDQIYCAKIGIRNFIHRELAVYLRTKHCPQIATAIEVGDANDPDGAGFEWTNAAYLIMETFPRGSLQDKIDILANNEEELMSEDEVWKVALNVSAALKFLATGQLADRPDYVKTG